MYFIVNNKFCVRQLIADGDTFIENHYTIKKKCVCFLFAFGAANSLEMVYLHAWPTFHQLIDKSINKY